MTLYRAQCAVPTGPAPRRKYRALEQYRIWQARRLLKIVVQYEPHIERETEVFVSLSTDRHATGGYRELSKVLRKPDLRNQLLEDAKAELRRVRTKYAQLQELTRVFVEIDKL